MMSMMSRQSKVSRRNSSFQVVISSPRSSGGRRDLLRWDEEGSGPSLFVTVCKSLIHLTIEAERRQSVVVARRVDVLV